MNGFKVYDCDGNDVSNEHEWYIDREGNLYYMTSDIDCPLASADDYWIEML